MNNSPLEISVYKNDDFSKEIVFAWEIVNPGDYPHPQTVVPALCFDLIFPLKGFLKADEAKITEPFVSPILTIPKNIQIGEHTRLIGIRFSALHFKHLTSIHPDKLKQTFNPLESFIPAEQYGHVIANLTKSIESEELLKILIDLLVQEREHHKSRNPIILNKAIHLIKEHPKLRITDICEMVGLSLRWMEMVFREFLGTSPSSVRKVIQFNKAVSLIYSNSATNLTDIALISGYFDQSHFIKSFKQFTGKLPSKFAKEDPQFYKVMNAKAFLR